MNRPSKLEELSRFLNHEKQRLLTLILQEFGRLDCCISSACIVTEALQLAGYDAKTVACEVQLKNQAFFDMEREIQTVVNSLVNPTADEEQRVVRKMAVRFGSLGAKMVHIGGEEPTFFGTKKFGDHNLTTNTWNGHAVTVVEMGGHQLVVDLTLGQATRPDDFILALPVVDFVDACGSVLKVIFRQTYFVNSSDPNANAFNRRYKLMVANGFWQERPTFVTYYFLHNDDRSFENSPDFRRFQAGKYDGLIYGILGLILSAEKTGEEQQ